MNLNIFEQPEYILLKQQNDAILLLLEETNKKMLARIEELTSLLDNAYQEIKILRKALYGSSSEKISAEKINNNLKTQDNNKETTDSSSTIESSEPPKKPKKPRTHAKRKDRKNLQSEVEFITCQQTVCTECNGELTSIGTENSKKLDFHLQAIKNITLSREKKHCRCCNIFVTAEIPSKYSVLPNTLASSTLLTQIAVSKYIDHMPWYRQENILHRSFAELSRQTMWDWMSSLATLLKPLYNKIHQTLLNQSYLQGDEVPIGLRLNKKKTKALQKKYMWSQLCPYLRMVCFHFGDRSSKTADKIYKGFKGYLQTDAYSGYDILKEVLRLSCLAHCRRKFVDLDESDTKYKILLIFHEIYNLEAEIKNLEPTEKQKIRSTTSKALFLKLKKKLEDTLADTKELKSKLVLACNYTLDQWDDVERILENPKFLIDNNAIERQQRPIVLGRKNWLCVCSELGGETLAILCTILHSAHLCGLDVFEYFNEMITRIGSHSVHKLDELMPCNWLNSKKLWSQ